MLTLPERYRDAILMFYFEEKDLAETARVLGIAEGTLKAQTAQGTRTVEAQSGAAMTPEELDRILSSDDTLEPSSGFASKVMASVRREAEPASAALSVVAIRGRHRRFRRHGKWRDRAVVAIGFACNSRTRHRYGDRLRVRNAAGQPRRRCRASCIEQAVDMVRAVGQPCGQTKPIGP